jgi:hypothetical protein
VRQGMHNSMLFPVPGAVMLLFLPLRLRRDV